MSTPYHSMYWASLLSLRGSAGSMATLSRAIGNARVDLNPHQVDAALFAFRSPFSRGVLLADEVGLGKTIEAGIVLSQRWAERRRRLLLILPATLRKQWFQELEEKFYLPSLILESRNYNLMKKDGAANPFDQADKIVLCSYHFAAARVDDIKALPWDLIVVDEAHRLRNVYKKDNKIARAIAGALGNAPKLLLTATPLQNNLMELYGLVSFIDPHVFGDAESFREQFGRAEADGPRFALLRQRLKPVCTRTLRKQVLEYIRFTERIPITQDFTPSDAEQELYDKVSAYLQKPNLAALPTGQRKLMTLVLRKLLASSSFAISGTLDRLVRRLETMQAEMPDLGDDYESLEELQEEWEEEAATPPQQSDAAALREELAELRAYANLARTITHNAKGDALLAGLRQAFEKAEKLGARPKAVVFTESRRTQQFLFDLLTANGYAGRVVMLNGANTDPVSKAVYQQWLKRHAGHSAITGSRTADIKSAITEEFRDRAAILVATEAAAEGVNFQFCSLVVNYDLPWNPQRIEQRIGRCHRYGQEHDVVVVNFLNRRNEADQRVFQLLAEKFRLFDGVFGASDEILGAIESGVDFERRIAEAYQECRTAQDIQAAFDRIQAELETEIQNRMAETRQALLDNFDEEVHARLRINKEEAESRLSEREQWLLSLARQELGRHAKFDRQMPRFQYTGPDGPQGFYHVNWKWAELQGDEFFRADHPLAVRIIQQAVSRSLPPAELIFDYRAYGAKVYVLEPFIGQLGWLELSRLRVSSVETEESLVFAATTDEGGLLDHDLCVKLMNLPARHTGEGSGVAVPLDMEELRKHEIAKRLAALEARNGRYFDEEVVKLEQWAEDVKLSLEQEIKALDAEIREARKASLAAVALSDKLAAQKHLKGLEARRKEKRQRLFDAQDDVDQQRETLIGRIEAQLRQKHDVQVLFRVRWRLT